MDVEDCKRHKAAYRGKNLYIAVSPVRVDISTENADEYRTVAGVLLIERLINELLSRGMGLEGVAAVAFECSYQPGDLPDILSRVLVK